METPPDDTLGARQIHDRALIQLLIHEAWRGAKPIVAPISRRYNAVKGRAALTSDTRELVLMTYTDPTKPSEASDTLPALIVNGVHVQHVFLRAKSKAWVVGFAIGNASAEEALAALCDNPAAYSVVTTVILKVN